MKAGTLFLMALMLSFHLCAQTVTIREKSISLPDLFKEIHKQTGFEFLYNSEMIEHIPAVSINVKDETISHTLDGCFKTLPLTYAIIDDKTIIVRRKKLLPVTADTIVRPAKKMLKGIVTDESGQVVQGASVQLKGTRRGVFTDNQGRFSIEVSDIDADSLTVSYVGLKSRTVFISGSNLDLDIMLYYTEKEMNDVVVSTGYQEINKDSYTGTAVTVSGAELKKVNPQSVLQSLQVFDPSFKIVENNLAGSNPNTLPNINVRGSTALPSGTTDAISRNTLSGTVNMPTFILDGYEVDVQKIFDLDINRVKSVTLLKDAAATAVYGSRAANGVVVIVTNPPKEGKLQVSYNYEMNVTTPDLSAYHELNATQKLQYEKLAGLYSTENNPALTQDQLDDIYYHKLNLVLSGVNTDWLAQPVRTTYGQKHSLYIEGGSSTFRYGLAVRYQTDPGVMKGSTRDRYSTDLDLSYNIGNKFLFKNSVSITQMNSRESPYGNFSDYVQMNPYYPMTDSAGKIAQLVDSWTDRSGAGGGIVTKFVLNPLYNATLGSFNKSAYLQLIDAFSADWTITQGLRLRGLISINQTRNTSDNFESPFANDFYFYGADQLNQRGSYDYSDNVQTVVDGSLTLNYNKRLGHHFINLVAGGNLHTDKGDYKSFSAVGFSNDRFSNIGFANSYAPGSTPYGDVSQQRLAGAFTSLNYSYNDIYLLDFTFREDGSSDFGSNKRVAPFNALGIGWNIHKEKFMEGSVFSRLKVRASTGITGSVSFSPYMAQTTYSYYTSNWYATGAGAIVNNYGNSNLEWQQTRDNDLGMEIGFMHDRLLIMPRYYYKYTRGLIADVTLPPSTGFSSYKDNIGDMRNTGWELNFQYGLISNKNFNLNLTANLVHNKNVIAKISDALKAYNSRADQAQSDAENVGAPLLHYQEGQSLNTIYAVKSLGIDPENGREIYVKKDGTLTYDWSADDIVPVGNADPKVEGYFGSSIRYKQFNMTFNFYTRWGGKMYNQTLVDRVENADPRYNEDIRALDEKWKQPGDHTFYKSIADLGQTQVSSRFVENDEVLQLSSLYLSYDAKKSFYSKLGMGSLRFAFTMNDVFRLSSVRMERGIDYPYAHSFTFSLTADF